MDLYVQCSRCSERVSTGEFKELAGGRDKWYQIWQNELHSH